MEQSIKQQNKTRGNLQNLKHFVKGQSGNPAGRPKGKSLKEYQAEKFRTMTDEGKEKWIKDHKISADVIWRMAEGNPDQQSALTGPNNEPLFDLEHQKRSRELLRRITSDPKNAEVMKTILNRVKILELIEEASLNNED